MRRDFLIGLFSLLAGSLAVQQLSAQKNTLPPPPSPRGDAPSNPQKKETQPNTTPTIQPKKTPTLADRTKDNNGCIAGEAAVYVPNGDKPPLLVCEPLAVTPCNETEDLLLDLAYPHEWGRVLIPKEARCGGSFDLILLLHGVVLSPKKPSLMLGGGATEKDRYLEKTVRSLLDENKTRPILIADPTDIGTSCQLYDKKDFDFLLYFERLHAELQRHKLQVRSISAAGHSGSACCMSAGMFRIIESFPDLKLWGSIDSCYGNQSYAKFITEKLPAHTTKFTMTLTGKFQGSSYLKSVLGASPQKLKCDEKFDACQKHAKKPWYVFQTRAKNHHFLPEPYVAEMLERFFPAE
jgi:hypothetical protein